MNKLIPQEVVEKRIYLIRRQKVMIDRDLAELLWCRDKSIKSGGKKKY